MEEEVFVVLSYLEKKMIRAVQSRKLGGEEIDWAAMAQDIKVSELYLEAICTLQIPENSKGIPMRKIEKAMTALAEGLVCWA
jgi:hypothetical protein